jgi:hypothetical protein
MKTAQRRAQYMTQKQISIWDAAEKKEGRKIPRTHENCGRIFGRTIKTKKGEIKFFPGPSRPGKTAKDRANKGR